MAVATIGIAGYMGSGKSSAAGLLTEKGFTLLDADRIAREIMQGDRLIQRQLVEAFGEAVLDRGDISFVNLGKRVFQSEDLLARLNSIVHPPLLRALLGLMQTHSSKRVVLDAALIPLWNIESWFDVCIWIVAPFETRLERLQEKSNSLDRESLTRRMVLQERMMRTPKGPEWTLLDNSGPINLFKQNLVRQICLE